MRVERFLSGSRRQVLNPGSPSVSVLPDCIDTFQSISQDTGSVKFWLRETATYRHLFALLFGP